MLKFKIALTSFFFFISFFCFSQRDNTYTIDASAILGSEQTPFWMRANKFGKVPTKGQTIAAFAGINSDYQNSNSKIDWGYGLNIGGFAGIENKFIIQQAYAKAKWRAFEIYAGRREEIQGLVDTTLSSGSYIWSGNALPMPKIDISIPLYIAIGPSGIFSIKGNYAHGWFDRDRQDAKGLMLHQKSFYLRVGKPNYKFKFYGGFNHQAQWGGTSKYNNIEAGIKIGDKFNSDLQAYSYIVSGRSTIGSDTAVLVGSNEKANRLGNHLGTLDIAFELKLKILKFLVYRQSIFEDGSLFYLNNITDGLHGVGVEITNTQNYVFKLKRINFEYLNTHNQGGPFYDNNPLATSLRGSDNYFNNSQFRDGWSYQKTSIGSPFMLTNDEFKNPKFDGTGYFTNIRVQSYSLGVIGQISSTNILGRISYSQNWGNFNRKFSDSIPQTSFIISASRNIEKLGFEATVNLAGDIGELLENNFALQIGIKKTLDTLPFSHPTHKH